MTHQSQFLPITQEDNVLWERWIERLGQHDCFLFLLTATQLVGDRRDATVMRNLRIERQLSLIVQSEHQLDFRLWCFTGRE